MNQPASSFTNASLHKFLSDGFVVLPDIVPAALLQKLRNLFDEEINDPQSTRKVINTVEGKNYISNIDHLLTCSNPACVELLGLPAILETARAICGDDFFLIQEFAVIKMLGDNLVVDWHKDFLHQRTGRCCNMGIYLDDADENDGCLHVIPGSHLSDEDICILKEQPSVTVPVKAGDILVHDLLLAHASGTMQRNAIRRVIYFEFLSYSQAIRENIYTEEQLYKRMQLQALAIEYYQQQYPAEKKFEWKNLLSVPPPTAGSLTDKLAEIHSDKPLGKPSAYCFSKPM